MKTKWTFGAAMLSSVVVLNLAPAASEGGVAMEYTWNMTDIDGNDISIIGYGNTDEAVTVGTEQEILLSNVQVEISLDIAKTPFLFDIIDDVFVYMQNFGGEDSIVGFLSNSAFSDDFIWSMPDIIGIGIAAGLDDLGTNYDGSGFDYEIFDPVDFFSTYTFTTTDGDTLQWEANTFSFGFSAVVVPAPGALALLALAGGMSSRRRRH